MDIFLNYNYGEFDVTLRHEFLEQRIIYIVVQQPHTIRVGSIKKLMSFPQLIFGLDKKARDAKSDLAGYSMSWKYYHVIYRVVGYLLDKA